MKVGFYAGSFDPFTIGHLHVVKVASKLFDKVVVAIGKNPSKKSRYDKEQMKLAIDQVMKDENLSNVECVVYNGLTADVAISLGASYLIRGIRNGMDYEAEENLALINEEISGIDTIYIRAGKLGMVSSSMVYELILNGKDVEKYLPRAVVDLISKS